MVLQGTFQALHHERGSFSFVQIYWHVLQSTSSHQNGSWTFQHLSFVPLFLVGSTLQASGTVILRLLANPCASLSTILLSCPPHHPDRYQLNPPFALEPPTHMLPLPPSVHSSVRHRYLPASVFPPTPYVPTSDNQWSPCHIQQTYLVPLRGLLGSI